MTIFSGSAKHLQVNWVYSPQGPSKLFLLVRLPLMSFHNDVP